MFELDQHIISGLFETLTQSLESGILAPYTFSRLCVGVAWVFRTDLKIGVHLVQAFKLKLSNELLGEPIGQSGSTATRRKSSVWGSLSKLYQREPDFSKDNDPFQSFDTNAGSRFSWRID